MCMQVFLFKAGVRGWKKVVSNNPFSLLFLNFVQKCKRFFVVMFCGVVLKRSSYNKT